jgi:transposase
VSAGEDFVPASELTGALKQIEELQRLLGEKPIENKFLRETLEVMQSVKVDCALPLMTRNQ